MEYPSIKNAGWQCSWCRVTNKRSAFFCQKCGDRWENHVMESAGTEAYSNMGHHRDQYLSYDNSQWPSSPRVGAKGKGKGKSQSPRPKQRRPHRHKGSNTNTHVQQQQATGAPFVQGPSPFAIKNAGEMSWTTAAAQAFQSDAGTVPVGSISSTSSKAEADLQLLLSALKKNREDAHHARGQLHASWRSFLALSVQQWQAFTQQFQNEEKTALERIKTAKEALISAKATLETSKESIATGAEASGAPEVQDLVSEDDAMKEENAASRIGDGLAHLTASLQALSETADKIHVEEQVAKKPRIDSALPGAAALQPFAQPGAKRP
ncbi:unnamed protein product [Cladocopium goreaui]|uniref:RanBP2-type domain-containing protein n=1 Tax=Cladocopium goreaui TaxID=2562237 RepID=A0A9P1BFJ6_9DINO|nr:unnamed protein product [Cladocopium goreaui]